MHAEAGAIEVVGGMEEMGTGGREEESKPLMEFQTDTGSTGIPPS